MRRWQAILALAVCVFLLDPLVAERLSAQTTENAFGVLGTRIDRVEHGLHRVQTQVFGDGRPILVADNDSGTGQPVDPTTQRLMERLDGLDDQVRNLTNQVQELGYQLKQLKAQFDQVTGAKAQSPAAGAQSTSADGQAATGAPMATAPGSGAGNSNPDGTVLSGNSAGASGLAPGETTLGQVPDNAVAGPPAPVPKPKAPSAQDQYNAAFAFVRSQDFPHAEKALVDFVANNPKTDYTGPALYWLGEVYFVQNDYQKAAEAFVKELKGFPDNPKAADGMLKLGMSLAALGKKDQACLTFGALSDKYPKAIPAVLLRAKVEAKRAGCKTG